VNFAVISINKKRNTLTEQIVSV